MHIQYRRVIIAPWNTYQNFCIWLHKLSAGADGGPRSWVFTRLTLRSDPHRHKRKFFGARVWGGPTMNYFPPKKLKNHLNVKENGRWPQIYGICKTASMSRNLENDLKYKENGKLKTISNPSIEKERSTVS